MARNIPKNEAQRSKEKAKPSTNKKPLFPQIEFSETTTQNMVFIAGLLLMLLGIFMFFAFFSHLFTGKEDQSELNAPLATIEETGRKTKNVFGFFGAKLADLFILRFFGISAFVIPPLTFLIGLKIAFKRELYALERVTWQGVFYLFWGSLFMGFWIRLFRASDTWGNLSGGFGYYTNDYLFNWLGGFSIFLIIFILAVFISLYYGTDTFHRWLEMLSRRRNTEDYPADEEASMGDIAKAKNIERVRNDLAKIKPKPTTEPLVADEEELFFEHDDNPDEESIRPHLPPVVEPNAEKPLGNPPKKEIALTIEETVEPEEAEVVQKPSLTLEVEKNTAEIDEDEEENSDDLVKKFGVYDPKLDLPHYHLPDLTLLKEYDMSKAQVSQDELNANSNKIVETLGNYGIGIANIKATIGPTVTLYEIIPDAGVRISKIKNLEDDIALSLAALGIRIIAPIPGKGTIGIEVPNKNREMVPVKMVIGSKKFQESNADLPIVLGKTISNDIFMTDLAKMPHLLMAGATGQGKSVGLNMILTSLLYKKHPSQLKFVLVDPKKVELTLFNKIERHFLAMLPNSEEAIITDTKKVVNTLNSLCIEMDNRYNLLKDAGCRNLKEYNVKFVNRRLNPENGHYYMPYIVLVIDELADLMMTAGKEVEQPIARLAQLARAIGIHLVIATQRPSVNVITGTIKANFPARLSFKVTSKIDSRTILDTGGAEQLVGMGDMLLSTGSDLIRLQCAFVDTPEVEDVCEFIGNQQGYDSAYMLPECEGDTEGGSEKSDFDPKNRDAFFDDAARLIVTHQQGSTSLIQRRLKLGYNRAGRLIDQLEAAGIVGPFEGSKAREVLVKDMDMLEKMLKSL